MNSKSTKTHERNAKIVVQTEDAKTCVKVLSKLGVMINRVEIGVHQKPRIEVDRPPRGLQGGVVKLQNTTQGRTATHAAEMHHCHIEWSEAG